MPRRKDPALRAVEEWTGHRGNLFGPPDPDPGTTSVLKAILALFLLILFLSLIAWLA